MNYPCEMIRDLLPLYIDDVCSQESKLAVEGHLSQCGSCRKIYDSMKDTEGYMEHKNENLEEQKMAASLKSVKRRINKKVRRVIICAAAVVIIVVLLFVALFSLPLKNVDLEDIKVSVESYSLEELDMVRLEKEAGSEDLTAGDGSDSVKISLTKGDHMSNTYRLEIPAMPASELLVTEDILESTESVSVISWDCPYFLRTIGWGEDSGEDGVLYVDEFKTTFLGNKAPEHLQKTQMLEFREINKVVYKNGSKEVVLWEK